MIAQGSPRCRAPCLPEEGQHLGTRDGASPLEQCLGVGCPVFLPCKLNSKGIAVNDLKVSHPECACVLLNIQLSTASAKLTASLLHDDIVEHCNGLVLAYHAEMLQQYDRSNE